MTSIASVKMDPAMLDGIKAATYGGDGTFGAGIVRALLQHIAFLEESVGGGADVDDVELAFVELHAALNAQHAAAVRHIARSMAPDNGPA